MTAGPGPVFSYKLRRRLLIGRDGQSEAYDIS